MPGHVSENTSGVLHIWTLANDTVPCQNFHLESYKQNAYTAVQGNLRTGRFMGVDGDS